MALPPALPRSWADKGGCHLYHPCDRLHRAAKKKNLDGATLASMEVMMHCVQCHKYVRDEQDALAR